MNQFFIVGSSEFQVHDTSYLRNSMKNIVSNVAFQVEPVMHPI